MLHKIRTNYVGIIGEAGGAGMPGERGLGGPPGLQGFPGKQSQDDNNGTIMHQVCSLRTSFRL